MKKVILFGYVILLAYLGGCTNMPEKVQTTDLQLSQIKWEGWQQELKNIQEEIVKMDEYWNKATDVFIGKCKKKESGAYVFENNWYYKQDGETFPYRMMNPEKNINAVSNEPKKHWKFKKITPYLIFSTKIGTKRGEIYRILKAYPLESEYTKKLNSLILDSVAKKKGRIEFSI